MNNDPRVNLSSNAPCAAEARVTDSKFRMFSKGLSPAITRVRLRTSRAWLC
jgi:hypothetical protein